MTICLNLIGNICFCIHRTIGIALGSKFVNQYNINKSPVAEDDGCIFLSGRCVDVCVVSVNVRVRIPVACAAPAGKIQEYWFCARISTLLDGENSSQLDVNIENLSMTAKIIALKMHYGDAGVV